MRAPTLEQVGQLDAKQQSAVMDEGKRKVFPARFIPVVGIDREVELGCHLLTREATHLTELVYSSCYFFYCCRSLIL
jgi:hypothetical protein